MKTEILYGIHSIEETLRVRRRRIDEIYPIKDKLSSRLKQITEAAESLRIPIKPLAKSELDGVASTKIHQGIAAKVSAFPVSDVIDIIEQAPDEDRWILVLDHVQDPQNAGALIRSACCAGIHGVIIPKDRSVSLTPTVSRASAGALEHMLVALVTNLSNTLNILKENSIWIAGMDKDSDRNLYDSDLTGHLCLIIGGEQKGISPLIRKQCDFMLSIPQKGQIESLNASAAGAVVMYEAFRQRMKNDTNNYRFSDN